MTAQGIEPDLYYRPVAPHLWEVQKDGSVLVDQAWVRQTCTEFARIRAAYKKLGRATDAMTSAIDGILHDLEAAQSALSPEDIDD